jgi:hypothetical protein
MEFDIEYFSKICEEHSIFIIHNAFVVIPRPVLRINNILDRSCRKSQNAHFMFNNPFFFEYRAVYEIMWKNTIESGRKQTTIWHMRIACWIPKATNPHSEYVILNHVK